MSHDDLTEEDPQKKSAKSFYWKKMIDSEVANAKELASRALSQRQASQGSSRIIGQG